MSEFCVYIHKNKINGKCYVGQTSKEPEERWKNGNGYKRSSPKFWKAIQKYGWDSFEHIILEKNITREQANEKEKEYIKLYNSIENGYNLTEGGVGGLQTKEVRDKISLKAKQRFLSKDYAEKMKKIKQTDEYREKLRKIMNSDKYKKILSEKLSGENNPMFGKHHSEETKNKMKEYHKNNPKKYKKATKTMSEETRQKIGKASIGRCLEGKSKKAKKVFCAETNQIFDSATQCSRKMNINYSSVRYCCQQNSKGVIASTKGYHLYYVT